MLKIPIVLTRNGVVHSLYVFHVYFVLPFLVKILPIYAKSYCKLQKLMQLCWRAEREMRYWRLHREELLETGRKGYRAKIDELGLDPKTLRSLREASQNEKSVVIAEIDQDGFFLSHWGMIPNVPLISEKDFMARNRFTLEVVAIDEYVGVQKHYKEDKLAFLYEIRALHQLGLAGCNVPAIIDVDFDNLTLTVSYILGRVLREELAKRGAILRDRDVDDSRDFMSLDPKTRWLKRVQEGKRVLHRAVDPQFVEALFAELAKIHRCSFIYNDVKYGNVIIEKRTGKPFLVDFEYARYYPKLGEFVLRVLRDQDVEQFNLHFNTEKLTYKIITEKIKGVKRDQVYAPVYFGFGLRMGSIWSVDAGYGRWHYILKHNLPELSGKRILDLGANNAYNGIQLLRSGASEVIGFELDGKYIAQGNFVQAVFEWSDNRQYNFKYIQADMRRVQAMILGEFDIVMALCSIYYLDDDSIARLVRHISTITDFFVLQCNTEMNIGRSDPHVYDKASVEYNLAVVKRNGFPITRVIAPFGYSRPLVIGAK
ncbi:MAG TPA: DUF1698 domain-containing protein [Sedimentisphaerales bacterium]|nr:DUF1698 domain-containing protein [Sedimentisphaerales bacterium]